VSARLEVAREAAIAAGHTLLELRADVISRGATATKSSATDPVTRADVAAQQIIAAQLTAAYPDDGLLGEEDLKRDSLSGWQWLIDPLDGTVNYLYGRDDWSVSIAAADAGGTAVAVVHAPATGRTYTAIRGQGSWLGDRRLHVRDHTTVSEALVGTGFSYLSAGRERQAATLARLLPEVADIRRSGSAALDLAAVAGGELDAFYEDDLNPWDWAAGALIATEAGAVVRPLPGPDHRSGVLAAPVHLAPLLAGLVTHGAS
jgi:myo-inositol-1(or 4)-monophosphatase